MTKVYVGLDVGTSTCHLVALNRDGALVGERMFETSEPNLIHAFGALKGEVHVHLEASELASWIRTVLRGRVARILVSNPKDNAWIAKDPRKRDRVDARKLAELLRTGLADKHEVFYSDDADRLLFKQLVQHYERLTTQESRLKNQIKSRYRIHGVIARGETPFSERGRIEFLRQVKALAARAPLEQLYELLDATLAAQRSARRLLRRESQRFPEIRLLDEVPGVGLIGACRFSAYIQNPHRFSSKRKLWRYCRLGIAHPSSDGKALGRPQLDWNGNGRLKDMSFVAFGACLRTRQDNMFRRTYRAVLERTHNRTHARLTTQRKILAVLRAMWKEGAHYQDHKG
jgi:transposase